MKKEDESSVGILFDTLEERHFRSLFLLLILLFFGVPLFFGGLASGVPIIAKYIYLITFFFLLIGIIRITSRKKGAHWMMISSSVIALLLNAVFVEYHDERILLANNLIIAAILIYIIVSFSRYLFSKSTVTQYTLYAALSNYLLIAFLWVMLYGIADILHPGAFDIPLEISPDRRLALLGNSGSFHGLYFSIVTITTLGYGDITPVSQVARTLCSLEALVGQMYLAIMVARLVGLYAAQGAISSDRGAREE